MLRSPDSPRLSESRCTPLRVNVHEKVPLELISKCRTSKCGEQRSCYNEAVDGSRQDAENLPPVLWLTASQGGGNLYSRGHCLHSVKFRMKTSHFTANHFWCHAISEAPGPQDDPGQDILEQKINTGRSRSARERGVSKTPRGGAGAEEEWRCGLGGPLRGGGVKGSQ